MHRRHPTPTTRATVNTAGADRSNICSGALIARLRANAIKQKTRAREPGRLAWLPDAVRDLMETTMACKPLEVGPNRR